MNGERKRVKALLRKEGQARREIDTLCFFVLAEGIGDDIASQINAYDGNPEPTVLKINTANDDR